MVQVLHMKIVIIGGGAAGLMAMATILEQNSDVQVTLVERNDSLGKKVIISGGGRCNVTTGLEDVKSLLTKYPRGGKFLLSAMHQWPPQATKDWFIKRGVPLKTEADLRVFPVSDNGQDIVKVFEQLFTQRQATVLLKASVIKVVKQDKRFAVYLKGQIEPLLADKLIITTGGQAYRQTGSTGDGYAFALALGHTISQLAPSLNAFQTQETWPATLAGLSFKSVKLTVQTKKVLSFTGPFLFTHQGLSGPAVFALSSLTAWENYNAQAPLNIKIDFFPEQTREELISKIKTANLAGAKKNFYNILSLLVSKSLIEVMASQFNWPPNKHAGEISKKELVVVATWLKGLPLKVIRRGAGDEFVTAGGVNLKEVNPSTMESRLCPGLYFAGEILDVDGFTGGFNLQASWATGRLAGTASSA
ncbi:NAD(P)/FAD-dependent oxidoreductase [Patescibacteria group bacterium]|nr:NAD(P)/FAD-dependent oxidoreductase [Patescibacteria group bacterium]